jgi:hypothetical protein
MSAARLDHAVQGDERLTTTLLMFSSPALLWARPFPGHSLRTSRPGNRHPVQGAATHRKGDVGAQLSTDVVLWIVVEVWSLRR